MSSGFIDEVGTSELSAVSLQRRIGARTGGMGTAMLYEQLSGEAIQYDSSNKRAFVVSRQASALVVVDVAALARDGPSVQNPPRAGRMAFRMRRPCGVQRHRDPDWPKDAKDEGR